MRGAIYESNDATFNLWMRFSWQLHRLLEALQDAEGLDVLTRLSPIRDAAERHVRRYSGVRYPDTKA
ncbi:MAG: hypothetical protein GVY12_04350, partial [Bacteroidetes bacterium]|nr:hypothetical protein [Bacteroidota bacterium]